MNSLLWRAGVRVSRLTSDDSLEALIYRRLTHDFFFVQIGANDGKRYDPIHDLVVRHHLRGLAVEPLGDMFRQLQRTYAEEPQVRLANVAIHRSDPEVSIFRVRPDLDVPEWALGLGSMDPAHHRRSGIDTSSVVAERVRAVSLEVLLAEHGVERFDLLVVDTEGYDFEIVRMLLESDRRPPLVVFEHSMKRAGTDPIVFWELGRGLMSAGYFLMTQEDDAIAYQPWR